jgi:hypothetical protein
MATWVEDEDIQYTYNGSNWVKLGSTVNHTNLSDLNSSNYYHLTQTEYNNLTDGGETSLHNHDSTYLGIGDKAADSDKLDNLDSTSFLRSDLDDSVSANTTWDDNNEVRLGSDSDLILYHDGTHNYIDSADGEAFYLRGNSKTAIGFVANQQVEIYYNGSKKLNTTNSGVNVVGTMSATTVEGANVTSGSDPGHTHTAYADSVHNHDDRYYTETELDNGQLDNRYFTETELTDKSTALSLSTLILTNGTSINEFSTDDTLAGDSDDAVPTEQAVKAYVDNELAGLSVNSIYEGDSGVFVDDTGTGTITVSADGSDIATWNASGLSFTAGTRVSEFSTDGTLAGDSDNAVPTEQAVKTYVDANATTITHSETVTAAATSWTVDHNLSTYDIIVQCWNGTGADAEVIVPDQVKANSNDQVYIDFGTDEVSGRVVIIGF